MKKVVIIGAGPAGLSCAYKLLKENKKISVTVLEESSDVGGISKTVNYKGNRIDIGGHRFFTKNDEVSKLWFDLLPLQGKPAMDDKMLGTPKKFADSDVDPDVSDDVMLIRNRVSRIFYNRAFFDYPVNLNLKTIKTMGFNTTCVCGFSYIKASLFKLEECNLENFYINRFGKKLYSMFFEGYTTKVWGRSPKEIDSSWGSQRVKGVSIRRVISDYLMRIFKIDNKKKETSLIESFYYPKYGPGEFYEKLAERVQSLGGKILTESKVIKIKKEDNNISNVTYVSSGKTKKISCDILVSSMPLKDLISSMNDVSQSVKKVSDNLPYRDFITVGLLLRSPKVKNKQTIHGGISDNWLYIQDSAVKVGRIQFFNNWSCYMVKDPLNTMWIGLEYFCLEGDDFWNMSDKELKDMAAKELKEIDICEGEVLDSVVIRVKKAYPAYFDSYANIEKVRKYLNKVKNLYCIGRNGTHSYNNMDHSIYSGFVCADMIKNDNHDLDKLWNINVDKSYQEEK